MRFAPRYFLFGLCLSLVGASPAREKASSGWSDSLDATSKSMRALVAGEDGRLSVQAARRRFEFGEGELAISTGDSSWTYRFQGSRGGIRALSISTLPEQRTPGSLEYTHGEGIVERYLIQSRGVEQQFVLPGPYAGGDVLLTGSVATGLVPDKTSSFEGIAFQRGDVTVLYYGEAKAIDAAGRTALLEERWSQGELTIVVPASFLASAKFPVLVDPFIGGRATVDPAVDLAQNPAVATRGGSPTFQALAVWSTNLTSPRFIRGRIIDPHGNTIVGPISVVDEFSGGGTTYTKPRVAWSGSVWVVAAEGHAGVIDIPNFIQVNKVDTSGTKTTGTNLNAVLGTILEADVDVACNNSGLCLITWLVDRDDNGTLDSVKGVFYAPSTNTFGAIFPIFDGTVTRSHSRVASNGTNFYEVNTDGANFIEGWSITTGGSVTATSPSQTVTAAEANPAVSYNGFLNKYLVAWDTGAGNTIRATTLSGATPPVPSGSDAQVTAPALNPQLTSQDYRGWSAVVFQPVGSTLTMLVRPDLSHRSFFYFDSIGSVPSADVAHFYRGLSIAIWEDERGSATDHDILAREFLAPSIEYADFNNNGWASAFVWRPGANAYFYFSNDLTTGSPAAASVQFGTTGDIPVRVDYNGDGITDLAVFRPSNGTWYIDTDRNGTVNNSFQFGAPGDIPVPGDYDGDGRTDIAVFRPSNGTWYIRYSASGSTISVQFGTNGDIPVPADYGGDFNTDIAVWRPSTGTWYVDLDNNGTVNIQAQFGTAGDIPVPGDYDTNPTISSPFAVFRPSNGTWYVDADNIGFVNIASQFGAAGDIAMQQPSGQHRN